MNKFRGHFLSFKLNNKITLLIIGIIAIPLLILSVFFFENIRASRIRETMKNVELNFTENYTEIQKKVEMGIMSNHVVTNSQSFWDNIVKFCTANDTETADLLYFYKNDIAAFEKLVNSNPYLYQIRVFISSDNIPEMMPVLYHHDRMMKLSWANEGFESGTWQFDYVDTTFAFLESYNHLVSYVTTIDNIGKDIDATIEVSLKMESLFPDLYSSTDDNWTCFIDGDGNYYFNTNYESKWKRYINDIYHNMKTDEKGYSEVTKVAGTNVIINYKPIKELNGNLIKIVSIDNDINSVKKLRNWFWVCFSIILIILILLSNQIVKLILKQFFVVTHTVREVQKGNLSVRIPSCGNDEIGELGKQINKMMDRITQLMEDNIKRELLAKDSEIRALQNQINAHFIYNVLESIKMMAEIDEKYEISNAVTSLGKLLRYSMKWTSKNVTVEEEIDYIKNYLALINLRFDYEIYLSLNIPDRIYSQKIPKMSLQPIIENAIYHGIEELAEDTNIYMKGIIYEDYCTIEITDAGRGMSEEEVIKLQQKINGEIEATGSSGNGIGLKNVQDRIKISFGDIYGISISSKKGCYTKVIVKIPLV